MSRRFSQSDREFADAQYAESIAVGKKDLAAGMKALSNILLEGPGTRAENLKLAEGAEAAWDRSRRNA